MSEHAIAKPGTEHQWLLKMIGEWACEGEATMAPGQPPVKWESTESVRSLGGFWVLAEGVGESPAGESTTTVMTLGYDATKQSYVGTFVASMMSHLWIYEGRLDAGGTTLTLETEGPGMSAEVPRAAYKDVIAFEDDDHRTLTSLVLGAGGEWQQVMKASYRRTR